MKTALKSVVVLCAFGLLIAPALAGPTNGAGYYGGRAYYDRVTGYFTGSGGEFTIRSDGAPGLHLSNAAYALSTRGRVSSESFQTFCIEAGEYVAQPLDVWVSTAWAGAASNPQWDLANPHSPQSHSWDGGAPAGVGDDLNPQTAYLYYRFAKGVLSNYNYTAGSGRSASAGQLQNAIWYLEGEGSSITPGTQAATWVQEAVNMTGLAFGSFADQTPGVDPWGATIGDVRVLQMWWFNADGSDPQHWNGFRQDQLYVIPAPGAALLGAIGIGLVGWLKRRLS